MLTSDEKDVLRELINIAFGTSTAAISDMLESFATLHIPTIEVISVDEMRLVLNEKIRQADDQLIATSQLFFGDLDGETVFVVDEGSAGNLARQLGNQKDTEKLGGNQVLDVILEVGNILSASCLIKLNELLGLVSVFTLPSVEFLPKEGITLGTEDRKGAISGDANAILINTALDFQEEQINGSLYIVLDPASFITFVSLLKKFIE